MKKNTHFILFAAGILFLLLAALAIWLGLGQHRMTSKTVSPAESEADAVLQALQDMTAEQPAASASATEIQSETAHTEPKATDELRIWVGDSRTLGMGRRSTAPRLTSLSALPVKVMTGLPQTVCHSSYPQ